MRLLSMITISYTNISLQAFEKTLTKFFYLQYVRFGKALFYIEVHGIKMEEEARDNEWF